MGFAARLSRTTKLHGQSNPMSDFALVSVIINVTLLMAAIWWWARFGRHHDRWRIPLGGVAVALAIILISLIGDSLMGRS
jgi:hypothetical protein